MGHEITNDTGTEYEFVPTTGGSATDMQNPILEGQLYMFEPELGIIDISPFEEEGRCLLSTLLNLIGAFDTVEVRENLWLIENTDGIIGKIFKKGLKCC